MKPCMETAVLVLSLGISGLFAQNPASRLISAYPEVDPESPIARRAQTVFQTVARAADSPVGVTPRLVLLDTEGRTWAFAGEDGRVVVTRKALQLCYRGGLDEAGDARLAFVAAHELDHLAQGDFSHFSAFSDRSDLAVSSLDRRDAEIRADRRAAVTMWIAGYQPGVLIKQTPSFFSEWASQALLEGAYAGESHPSPRQRFRIFEQQMQEVLDRLENFKSGLRAYQVGAYEVSVRLLEPFARRFPGRAVVNNLGLSYLQLAVRRLAQCDGAVAMRFQVPTLVDPITLAAGSTRRGTASSCYSRPEIISNLQQSRTALERVLEWAPDYYPARLNHASLLVLTGRGAGALASLAELPEPFRRRPEVRLLTALATYLHGEEEAPAIRSATRLEALATLRQLLKVRSPLVIYNLAAVQSEIQGPDSARKLWKQFLELEPSSPYADLVRRRLGNSSGEKPASPTSPFSPPIRPGPVTPEHEQWLQSQEFDRRRLESDHSRITLYSNSECRVLREDDRLVFVEVRPREELLIQAVSPGSPERIVESTRESFWAFHDFGFVVDEARVTRVVFFGRPPHEVQSGS